VNGAKGGKWDSPQFASNKVMKIRLYFIVGMLMLSLFGCGDKPNANDPLAGFKPNKAELGTDWKQFRHDASFNCWNFGEVRPAEHLTPQGARVYHDGAVTGEELGLIDGGLSEMLGACRQDTNAWQPGNIWTKFAYFQNPKDFKVILVPSNYTVQEGEAAGCGGIITGAHGVLTAAGTVCGMIDKYDSHMPASKGGIYIVVAKQSAEQLAKPACKAFMQTAIRNEAEHLFLSNDTNLYFQHANDGAGGFSHPYCVGMR
jgi:hypothetical protein